MLRHIQQKLVLILNIKQPQYLLPGQTLHQKQSFQRKPIRRLNLSQFHQRHETLIRYINYSPAKYLSKTSDRSSENPAEDQGSSNKESKAGMITSIVFASIAIVVIAVILVIMFLRRNAKEEGNDKSTFADSEMDTADYFTSTNSYDQDDPLWGSTEECPMLGDLNEESDLDTTIDDT